MYKKILNFLFILETNKILSSIKKGFMITFPIVLIGSFALLIRNFPVPVFKDFILTWQSGILGVFLLAIYEATVGCISIYLVLSISYYYAQTSHVKSPLLHMTAMFTSLMCFIISFGGMSGSLEFGDFGALGVFTALLCSIVATQIFLAISVLALKDYEMHAMGADDNFKISVVSIVPMLTTLTLFALFHITLSEIFHTGSLNELFSSGFIKIFDYFESDLANGLFFTFALNSLWFFGIHGGNALDQVAQSLFVSNVADSSTIITKSFLDVFAQMGGSGATICLVVALLVVSRTATSRLLARSALPMIIFNINELIVFGLPIVLNPVMLVPFILVPIASLLIAYVATIIGLIPIITETVSWTVPMFLSGYLATNNFSGVLVQLIILVVGVLIYIPFVRLLEKIQLEKESRRLESLLNEFRENEKVNAHTPLLDRTDDLAKMVRTLVVSLKQDVKNKSFDIYYQPQVNEYDKVIGAEGLLRWRYNGNLMYPPLVIALAREDNFLDWLTWEILVKVCNDIGYLKLKTKQNLNVSVNLSANQFDDTEFIKKLIALAKDYNVQDSLYLEMTEDTSFAGLDNIEPNIELLINNGIQVAIDDFGMGQTSLTYLKSNNFKYVKMDGELVRQILVNPRCSQIITTIITLGKSLEYEVVAEYVENLEIKNVLLGLGCKIYQGYYYSPAVPKEKFIDYCNTMNHIEIDNNDQI